MPQLLLRNVFQKMSIETVQNIIDFFENKLHKSNDCKIIKINEFIRIQIGIDE